MRNYLSSDSGTKAVKTVLSPSTHTFGIQGWWECKHFTYTEMFQQLSFPNVFIILVLFLNPWETGGVWRSTKYFIMICCCCCCLAGSSVSQASLQFTMHLELNLNFFLPPSTKCYDLVSANTAHFCARYWTQGFMNARQILCQLSYIPQPFSMCSLKTMTLLKSKCVPITIRK